MSVFAGSSQSFVSLFFLIYNADRGHVAILVVAVSLKIVTGSTGKNGTGKTNIKKKLLP